MANTLPAQPSRSPGVPRWPVIRNPFGAYALAVALTSLALVLRLELDPILGNAARLSFFMFAATMSAFLFGRGPGITSTVLGTLLGIYFFVQPRHSFYIANLQLGIGTLAAGAQGIVVSFCAGALHRALRLRAAAENETRALYESELRAHEATFESNRMKDYFLAVLSHELRGPLAAIQYCVADRLSDPAVPFELREDFALIERNARMQSRLIADLMDLTRLTRGKMEIELHPLNLHLLLVEAVRTCCAPSEANQAPIPSLHLRASHAWVQGDRDRLLQVFWNILRNAAKFTARDGFIEVDTYESEPGRIAVRIRDNGIGLSSEALARIFQPFEQAAQNNVDKKQGGLGLGLAIAKGIVELHDGTLAGESEGLGRGTAFIIDLPTINPTAPPTSSRRSGVGRAQRSGAARSPAPVAPEPER
jgi:signal transduction histidine kinase